MFSSGVCVCVWRSREPKCPECVFSPNNKSISGYSGYVLACDEKSAATIQTIGRLCVGRRQEGTSNINECNARTISIKCNWADEFIWSNIMRVCVLVKMMENEGKWHISKGSLINCQYQKYYEQISEPFHMEWGRNNEGYDKCNHYWLLADWMTAFVNHHHNPIHTPP